jgi:hypothetical protein
MRILVVCARFPELGQKGDQLRARQLIELLSANHQITVLTGGRPPSAEAARSLRKHATLVLAPVGRPRRVVAAAAAGATGLPLEVGWMLPGPMRRRLAALAGGHDVVIASTVRCLARPLPVPVVLDHIDPLSVNLRLRARLEKNPLLRLAAWLEARLLARHERRLAGWVAAQTVVSELEVPALPRPPTPQVLPHVIELAEEPPDGPRDIDVIFTGDMAYPPNREAAEWLAGEIVPDLRRRRGDLRVLVAGRAAQRLRLSGVEIAGDVPDLAGLIRRSRVAAVPLLSGTGVPNKLLEAAAGGCAIVATSRAGRAAGLDVETADGAADFAAAIDRLLGDEALRQERAAAARAGLEHHRREAVRAQLETILAQATGRPPARAASARPDRYNH